MASKKMVAREPVYQPRGTRDGSAGLKGKTVWVLMVKGAFDVAGVFNTRAKAMYHKKRLWGDVDSFVWEHKIR